MEVFLLAVVTAATALYLWRAALSAMGRRETLPPSPELAEVAERLALTYRPPSARAGGRTTPSAKGIDDRRVHRLTGTHRGIYVRVQTQEVHVDDAVLTRVTVKASLPALVANVVTIHAVGSPGAQIPTVKKLLGQGDIALGDADLDRALEIRGPIPSLVRAVLADAPVRSMLSEMTHRPSGQSRPGDRRHWSLQVGVGHVRAATLGLAHTEAMVRHAVEVAAVLGAGMERVLGELGGPLGLAPQPDHEGSLLRLRGDFGGFTVVVRHEPGTERAMVQATLRGDLPPGLVVRHKGGGEDGTAMLRLGDPILDRMLMIQSDDEDRTRSLLVRDDVRGPLLTVLVDHGGVLEGNQLDVVTEDLSPATLTAVAREVMELARVLSVGSTCGPQSGEP